MVDPKSEWSKEKLELMQFFSCLGAKMKHESVVGFLIISYALPVNLTILRWEEKSKRN